MTQATCATVVCETCGATFAKSKREIARYPRHYCGKSCAYTAVARRPRRGKELVGPVPRRTVVSGPTCRIEDAPTVSYRLAGTCSDCGLPFVARGLWHTTYCSVRCARRAGNHTRKRRKRKAQGAERVYRAKVYARDNYICRLCLKPLNMQATVPHPLAPTIDHIHPISIGGKHEPSNVQAAHFLCNSSKGSHVTQLAFAA